MRMPPRSAISRPASRASSSRGRTPAAKITRPESIDRAVTQRHATDSIADARPCAAIDDGADPDVHVDAEVGDHPAQQRTACLVELLGHQPRRHLDDVGVQAERAQRVGGFQAEQAATDHHADRRLARGERGHRVGADRVEVVERAIDVAARQVVARHRRHERVGTGGQHERVVVDSFTVGGDDGLGGPVDHGDPGAESQPTPAVVRDSRCRAARAGRGPSARCIR